MDLLGGYGSDDDDHSEPLAMNGPAAPPPADESSGENAGVQHTPHARAPNVAMPSIAPLPRIAAASPSAYETAASSAAQNPLGAAIAAATPAASQVPAPPPKRKLPSAAALLSAVPTSHTYAGFKSASSAQAAAVDERTDAIGTKYNTVALPSVLNETEDDATTWRRPPTRVNDSTISFAARAASAASASSSSTPSSSSPARATPAAAPKSSVTAFAPPQLAGRRANVVTEDVAAWNRAKKVKTAAAEQSE